MTRSSALLLRNLAPARYQNIMLEARDAGNCICANGTIGCDLLKLTRSVFGILQVCGIFGSAFDPQLCSVTCCICGGCFGWKLSASPRCLCCCCWQGSPPRTNWTKNLGRQEGKENRKVLFPTWEKNWHRSICRNSLNEAACGTRFSSCLLRDAMQAVRQNVPVRQRRCLGLSPTVS